MNFEIENEKVAYSGFLKVTEATVTYDSFDAANKSITATRECLERGDSVAVLLLEEETDTIIFTKQFRYPSARRDQPWMLELVAGSIDGNEDPKECAKREILEEIGFEVSELQKVITYFPSPGGCSEQIHIFFAIVRSTQQIQTGGGKNSEKEDIETIRIPKSEARKMLQDGAFNNSISIIGLQWYFLNEF